MPVASYKTGQLKQYTAAIYIGSTYDEPLPTAFLDDVYGATTPVIWAYDNIMAADSALSKLLVGIWLELVRVRFLIRGRGRLPAAAID